VRGGLEIEPDLEAKLDQQLVIVIANAQLARLARVLEPIRPTRVTPGNECPSEVR
jgi:hypothetical protein